MGALLFSRSQENCETSGKAGGKRLKEQGQRKATRGQAKEAEL